MKLSARLLLLSLAFLLCGMCHRTKAFTLPEEEDEEPTGSIEEILQKASNLTDDDFDIYYDPSSHTLVTEYDIAIPEEEWAPLVMQEPVRAKRTAGSKSPNRRWKNNLVNYEITNDFTAKQKTTIKTTLGHWSHYTCIKFQESDAAKARVVFSTGNGCFSSLGMTGKAQKLGLGPNCRYKKIILHEVGHALGLHHEQTRPDRDEHVTINFNNIPKNRQANFRKKTWDKIIDLDLPYDYYSIMHYTKKAFGSKNGGLTITTKDKKYQDVIGKQKDLSFGDIKTINLMYNCGQEVNGCQKKASDCPQEGFVGKDCACWCPGKPVQYCDESDRLTRGTLSLN